MKIQIQKLQEQAKSQAYQRSSVSSKNIPVKTGPNFEGVYRKDGVMYAVVKGHLLKPSDKMGQYELLDVAPHKAHFRNTQTGEISSFELR